MAEYCDYEGDECNENIGFIPFTNNKPPPPHYHHPHPIIISHKLHQEECCISKEPLPPHSPPQRASTPIAMVVSLIMIMICFVMGTPLSLFLSIPAYILADRVRCILLHEIVTPAYIIAMQKTL